MPWLRSASASDAVRRALGSRLCWPPGPWHSVKPGEPPPHGWWPPWPELSRHWHAPWARRRATWPFGPAPSPGEHWPGQPEPTLEPSQHGPSQPGQAVARAASEPWHSRSWSYARWPRRAPNRSTRIRHTRHSRSSRHTHSSRHNRSSHSTPHIHTNHHSRSNCKSNRSSRSSHAGHARPGPPARRESGRFPPLPRTKQQQPETNDSL